MPSSLRLSDLPVANNVNISDLFLSYDVGASSSKKVSLSTLNNSLFAADLADYNLISDDIDALNDITQEMMGTSNGAYSMSDLKTQIDSQGDSVVGLANSLSTQVAQLVSNIDTEIINRNAMDNSVIERVDAVEDFTLQAGLASGYVYVKQFKGG